MGLGTRSRDALLPPPPPSLNVDVDNETVFWPADILPHDCKSARVLTFGYDSKVSKYFKGAVNQNNLFSHAKDLLFALIRERARCRERPLIFVAHSLGGILVKDVRGFDSLPFISSCISIPFGLPLSSCILTLVFPFPLHVAEFYLALIYSYSVELMDPTTPSSKT